MSLIKHAKQYIANRTKYAHFNAFVSRVDSSVLDRQYVPNAHPETVLHDRPIAIKDNICTADLKTTAASGILKDFTSPYDATVVKLLRDEGAVVVGKTNMDEFGMGSHSTHSHVGPVKMQRYDGEEASAGGSSGGSALAVASAQCWAALGTDTGGSVRLPAAYSGVVGFKPSYGLLSRWGVIAYANSLDTVGVFAKNANIAEDVFDRLNVHDAQDPTSLRPETRARIEGYEKRLKSLHDEEKPDSLPEEEKQESLRIGIPLDYNIATLQPAVKNAWMRALRALAAKGHTLHPVRLPASQHALSAYYVLAPAEASSNLAKYDGVRFGSRAEGVDGTPSSVLFAKTRREHFGSEVQRRILLGAFTLSADAIDNYFIQAQKVRRLVQQDFNNVFAKANPLLRTSTANEEGVDILLCPTAPTLAPSLSSIQNQDPIHAYMNDVFTVPASLAGLPAVSVPIHITDAETESLHGSQDIRDSAGIQIIGQYGDDKRVLHAAWDLQQVCKTVQRNAGPDMTAWGHSLLGPATVNARKKHGPLALSLGITIAEAIPIAQAQLQERIDRVGNILEAARGAAYLAGAAKLANTSTAQYAEKFLQEEDPVAAEEAYFHRLVAEQRKVAARLLRKKNERKDGGEVRADVDEQAAVEKKASPVRKTPAKPRRTQRKSGDMGKELKIRRVGDDIGAPRPFKRALRANTTAQNLESEETATQSRGREEKLKIRFVNIDETAGSGQVFTRMSLSEFAMPKDGSASASAGEGGRDKGSREDIHEFLETGSAVEVGV